MVGGGGIKHFWKVFGPYYDRQVKSKKEKKDRARFPPPHTLHRSSSNNNKLPSSRRTRPPTDRVGRYDASRSNVAAPFSLKISRVTRRQRPITPVSPPPPPHQPMLFIKISFHRFYTTLVLIYSPPRGDGRYFSRRPFVVFFPTRYVHRETRALFINVELRRTV